MTVHGFNIDLEGHLGEIILILEASVLDMLLS